jgi:hypothetical protein
VDEFIAPSFDPHHHFFHGFHPLFVKSLSLGDRLPAELVDCSWAAKTRQYTSGKNIVSEIMLNMVHG